MSIINVEALTIEQLNDLIIAAEKVLANKVERERVERERVFNSHWNTIKTVIKQYEDNYTIMMRVRDNTGRVKHFTMNGDTDVTFELRK